MWKSYSRDPPLPPPFRIWNGTITSEKETFLPLITFETQWLSQDPRRRSQCTFGAKAILQIFFFARWFMAGAGPEGPGSLTGFWTPRHILKGRCRPTFPSRRKDTPLGLCCLMYGGLLVCQRICWPASYSLSLRWGSNSLDGSVVWWRNPEHPNHYHIAIRVEQDCNQIDLPNYT